MRGCRRSPQGASGQAASSAARPGRSGHRCRARAPTWRARQRDDRRLQRALLAPRRHQLAALPQAQRGAAADKAAREGSAPGRGAGGWKEDGREQGGSAAAALLTSRGISGPPGGTAAEPAARTCPRRPPPRPPGRWAPRRPLPTASWGTTTAAARRSTAPGRGGGGGGGGGGRWGGADWGWHARQGRRQPFPARRPPPRAPHHRAHGPLRHRHELRLAPRQARPEHAAVAAAAEHSAKVAARRKAPHRVGVQRKRLGGEVEARQGAGRGEAG
jgi:hypothetical protein